MKRAEIEMVSVKVGLAQKVLPHGKYSRSVEGELHEVGKPLPLRPKGGYEGELGPFRTVEFVEDFPDDVKGWKGIQVHEVPLEEEGISGNRRRIVEWRYEGGKSVVHSRGKHIY